MLPLAKRMASVAAAARAGGRPAQAQIAAQLEYALWATLPAFCSHPTDAAAAFGGLARELGEHLASRADLRGIICSALRLLIVHGQAALDGLEGAEGGAAVEADDGRDAAAAARPPPAYTEAVARGTLAAVAGYARNFLPLLFNLFGARTTLPFRPRQSDWRTSAGTIFTALHCPPHPAPLPSQTK